MGQFSFNSKQNFWQLATIQASSVGLPVYAVGAKLALIYGKGTAILGLLVGNLIVWCIGLAIIAMSFSSRSNAVENVKNYLGRLAAIIASLVLVIAFMIWFMVQLDYTVEGLSYAYGYDLLASKGIGLRIGAALGIILSMIILGGIDLIKWICTLSIPFIIIYSIYLCFLNSNDIIYDSARLSISYNVVIPPLLAVLAGIINLPTFFRHANNSTHAYLGLSLMVGLIFSLQVLAVFGQLSSFQKIFINMSHFHICLGSIYLLTLLVCANLVNIYFASAGWEAIVPKFRGPKELAIIGLIGTACYTFIQISEVMVFLENLAISILAALGSVLLWALLFKITLDHRPRNLEKIVCNLCWLVGIFVAAGYLIYSPNQPSQALIYSVAASTLTFIVILFIEETVWAARNLPK